jgi:hypothetical protein
MHSKQSAQYVHAITKRDARRGNDTFLIPQGKADLIKSTGMGKQIGLRNTADK